MEALLNSLDDHEVELLMLCKLIIAQSKDVSCVELRQTIRILGSAFKFDRNGGIVKNAIIDGSIQKLVSTSLKKRLLQKAHHSTSAIHPGERRIYGSLRRD